MVNDEYGRIRTNHVPNVREIQDDISGTVYGSQPIRNDSGKTTEPKTRKNGNTEVRDQSGHVSPPDDVEEPNDKGSGLSRLVPKGPGPGHAGQLGQNRKRTKRRNHRPILTSSHDSN